jgi:hypothetical protein
MIRPHLSLQGGDTAEDGAATEDFLKDRFVPLSSSLTSLYFVPISRTGVASKWILRRLLVKRLEILAGFGRERWLFL